jgi:hypothetical protein
MELERLSAELGASRRSSEQAAADARAAAQRASDLKIEMAALLAALKAQADEAERERTAVRRACPLQPLTSPHVPSRPLISPHFPSRPLTSPHTHLHPLAGGRVAVADCGDRISTCLRDLQRHQGPRPGRRRQG